MEPQQLKLPYIINSQNFLNESEKMVPIFHTLHITENTVSLQQVFERTPWSSGPQPFCNREPVSTWQFYRGPGVPYDGCYFSTAEM